MQDKILFNVPLVTGFEFKALNDLLLKKKFCGDQEYSKECSLLLEKLHQSPKALLTPSCTQALEMSALLMDIQAGDEIIMPAYTFVSTANAFVLRGAIPVFVDIRPDTMNIDETLIEAALTPRTKAIVVVHYAGVSCPMDSILSIAEKHSLYVIEDAAQAIGCSYKGQMCGSFGDVGALSFHETKNLQCGEGGAILIQNQEWIHRAEIIREKGTDRALFYKGLVDKYTWRDLGSSYLPSDLNAAFLYSQLQNQAELSQKRLALWELYLLEFKELQKKYPLELPRIPLECKHNGHIFWIKLKDLRTRNACIDFLNHKNIQSVFHYIPLHQSPAGQKFARFFGNDIYTTKESERILRLPLHLELTQAQISYICKAVGEFFENCT